MRDDLPQGRCSNLSQHCELAKAGTLQDMTTANGGCAKCGMALMSGRQESLRASFPKGLLLRAVAVLALILGASFGHQLFFKKPAEVAEAIAPADDPGTEPHPAAAESPKRGVLESYLLRLAGSSTIGAKLAPDLAEAWLRSLGATEIETIQRDDDQGDRLPERLVSAHLDGKLVGIEIKAYGTATGADALRDGSADVWMASAPVTDEEAQELKELGDMRAPASEHVVGLDGIAVIVSPRNALSTASKAQVKGLFDGAVKNWSELQQPAGDVVLYARDKESGTRRMFEELVLGPDAKMAPLAEKKPEGYADSEQLSEDVAADPQGVGFVGMAFVGPSKALAIKDGDAAALTPTASSVRAESYPLTRRLHLYTPAHPSEDTTRFLDFALGDAGQAIVQKSAVSLIPTLKPAAEIDGRPCRLSAKFQGDKKAFCDLRARSLAIDSSFRFRTGSFALDSLAVANLDRVAQALKPRSESRVVVAGFTDNRGDYKDNCRLSKQRAEAVTQELAKRGVAGLEARGYCSELPVRENAGPDFELNRRVELYLPEGRSTTPR